MNQRIAPSAHRRSLRPALLAALFLWIALAGLRPSPVLAACGSPTVVTTEAELINAINDVNGQAGPCAYEIEFGAGITLTQHLPDIDNGNAGITLLIDGQGFTLDGNDFDTFDINNLSAATIDNITIINSSDDALGSYFTNMRISRSAFMFNASDAIEVASGSLVVVDSTFAFNEDDGLDAFDAATSIDIINTTIAGNDDSALYIFGTSDPVLTHVTVVGNGTGLFPDSVNVTVNNSIFAANGVNCELGNGTVDFNFSLVDDTTDNCGASDGVDGNIVGDDPQLLPLGDNGGPTPTMLPFNLTGGVSAVSPVIDVGDDTLSVDETNAPLAFDQRGSGFPRVVGAEVDMGAVEGVDEVVCPTYPVTVVNEGEWREAIFCYNAIATPGGYTISLGAAIPLTASSPAIDNDTAGVSLVVEGNGHTIDGQDTTGVRPLTVATDTTVTVNDATITGGYVTGDSSRGGGVLNAGDLTLDRVGVIDNQADGNGGGIYNDGGTLAFNDGEISDNLAAYPDGDGGGINNVGDMTISRSAVINNTADGDSLVLGGGILNEGEMTITDSNVAGNTASGEEGDVFGGGINNQSTLVILNSTISDNQATGVFLVRGGGISHETDVEAADELGYGAELTIINSTISGNTATGEEAIFGGGLYVVDYDFNCCIDQPIPITLINTTVSDNAVTATESTDAAGGGAYFRSNEPGENTLAVRIDNSILGNSVTDGAPGGDCILDAVPSFDSNFSLYEDSGAGACGLAAANPDADGNIVGVDPALGPLADNGGPTPTHLPDALSPAIDSGSNALAVDENGDPLATDQRGYIPRIVNGTVDMGSVEAGAEPPPSDSGDIFLSANSAGTTGDGLAFGPHDVLRYDGTTWSKFFDGSAAGLTPNGNAKHNINALWIPDPNEEDVVMSFGQNARHVPGITPKVDGMDLVWYDGDTNSFSLWFDGNDVDLTNKTQEKIDALHVLPGGGPCLYNLLISTQGPGRVSNTGDPAIIFSGEDVLGFCATSLGDNTAGIWSLVLDGSSQGMPRNSTTSLSVSDDGQTLYLTTRGTFNVDSATGGHSMIYAYNFGSETFSGPLFIAADAGLSRTVNGLHVGTIAP